MLIHQFKSVYYRRLFDRAPTPDDLQKCSEHIAAGDTVFDLGANLGIYSKALSAMVRPAGQVQAVEMMPETYSYLRRNVTPLGNVLCYNVAVSDSTGVQHARLPGRRWGGGHIYRAHLAPAGITVRACRLDDPFPDLSPPFIKCDVEGAEAAVINGARAVIERCHPIWLIETSNPQIFSLMKSHGYKPRRLGDDWLFVCAGKY